MSNEQKKATLVPKYLFPSMNNERFSLGVETILKIDEKLTKFRIMVKDFRGLSCYFKERNEEVEITQNYYYIA